MHSSPARLRHWPSNPPLPRRQARPRARPAWLRSLTGMRPLYGGRNWRFPVRRMLNLLVSSPPPVATTDLHITPPPRCCRPHARTPRQYRLIRLRPESCCAEELSVCAPSSATYSPREDAHDGVGPRCWPCDTGAAPVVFRADYRAAVPPPTLPYGQHSAGSAVPTSGAPRGRTASTAPDWSNGLMHRPGFGCTAPPSSRFMTACPLHLALSVPVIWCSRIRATFSWRSVATLSSKRRMRVPPCRSAGWARTSRSAVRPDNSVSPVFNRVNCRPPRRCLAS